MNLVIKRGKNMSKLKKLLLSLFCITLIFVIGIVGYIGKIYYDIRTAANNSYEAIERVDTNQINNYAGSQSKEPFSVLLLGTDSGDLGRTGRGRSDTIMVATVNPSKKQTTIISIPRDTYVKIVGYNRDDKINHAYAYGGVPMAISTIENFLEIPINYYVQIDLKGLKELVNSLGGIEVNNPFSFKYEGTSFPIGKLKVDGENALKYSRMRYADPKGDYGRQLRQQQILIGIFNKIKTPKSLINYKNILEIVSTNLKTDISWSMMQDIFKYYREGSSKLITDQVIGEEFIGNGTIGDKGISYQKINGVELKKIRDELKKQLSN